MKKLLVVILAAALCVSMLAGCGSKTTEEPATSTATTETSSTATTETSTATTTESSAPAEAAEIKDFTCLAADVFTQYYYASEVMEEFYAWQYFKELEAAKGVNLVMEWVLSDQYETTLQTRFGAMNDIPYYVSGYGYSESNVLALAQNGVVIDLNTVFPYSDGTATNFFENTDFGATAAAKVTTPEGQMYWLPNLYISVFEGRYGVGTNCTVTIRGDWLNEQGLEMPTTTDEYIADLKAFNAAYGNNEAGNSVYSYRATQLNDCITGWFGLVRGLLNVNWDTDEATSPWKQEGFTEYIKFVNGMYNDGLYDPEMVGSNDTLRTKVANNQVGSYTAYALSTTYEPLIEACKDENGKTTACYNDIYPITAIEGIQPLLGLEDPVYLWDEFFITNQCTDLALAAAFIDGYYCDEHLDSINYGTEGHNYTVVNGEKQWMEYTAPDGNTYAADQLNQYLQEKADERISYGKILYIRGGFPDYTYYRLDDASHNCTNVLGWAAQKDEYQTATLDFGHWCSLDVGGCLATASVEETNTYNEKYSDVSTASEEYMSKLVQEGNVDDIPAYIATLDSLGLQDILDVYQARHNRFIA